MLKTYLCSMTKGNFNHLKQNHSKWILNKYPKGRNFIVTLSIPEGCISQVKKMSHWTTENIDLLRSYYEIEKATKDYGIPVFVQKNRIEDTGVIWGTSLCVSSQKDKNKKISGMTRTIEVECFNIDDDDAINNYIISNLSLIKAMVILESENLKRRVFMIPINLDSRRVAG